MEEEKRRLMFCRQAKSISRNNREKLQSIARLFQRIIRRTGLRNRRGDKDNEKNCVFSDLDKFVIYFL